MMQPEPDKAEQDFRAMQARWGGLSYFKRIRLAEAVGSSAVAEVTGDARLLRQALAIWDKEQK